MLALGSQLCICVFRVCVSESQLCICVFGMTFKSTLYWCIGMIVKSTLYWYIGMIVNDWQSWPWEVNFVLVYSDDC